MTETYTTHHPTSMTRRDQAAGVLVAALMASSGWWLVVNLLQAAGVLSQPLQSPDETRSTFWLGVGLSLLCWAPARRIGPGLVSRFDGVLLQPPAEAAAKPISELGTAAQQLRQWCFAGAGQGASPLLRPNALPHMDQPLSFAVWPATSEAERAKQQTELNAFMCQLDGTLMLLASDGPWAKRWLRLKIKLREALWWRVRRVDDPWDCGFLNTGPAAVARLGSFSPRRATLIVAQDAPVPALVALFEKQSFFGHPVRVLLLGVDDFSQLGTVVRIDDPTY